MSDAFGVFWAIILVIFVVTSSVQKSKQVNQKKNRSNRQPTIPYRPVNPHDDDLEASSLEVTAPIPVVKTVPSQTAASPLSPEGMRPQHIMEPTVHVHQAPECAVHDVPGSLGVNSTEGQDPCHEDQLAHVYPASPSAPVMTEVPGLALEWSGDSMVRAVIMQEVLQRPCQRRRR